MKKFAAIVTSAVLALGSLCVTAAADEETKTVNLRIEGISGSYCDSDFKTDKSTLYEFFKDADGQSDDFAITIVESEYGDYISAVNDDAAGAFGSYEGWLFTVNGKDPGVGMDSVEVKDGDCVVLYYGDPFGAGFQFPEADLSKLADGVITFTSKDTVYDADYNASVVVNPVSDMTVKWYTGEKDYKEYKTDANGAISIDCEFLTVGEHRVVYDKYNADGLPLVLRSAPGYSVTVEKDTVAGDVPVAAVIAVIMCAAVLTAVAVILNKKEKYA